MVWNKLFFKYLLPVVGLAVGLRLFLLQSLVVDTDRAQPLLFQGDVLMGYKPGIPKRGDLVIFRCVEHSSCVGSVLGLPGDRLDFLGQRVSLNEEKIFTRRFQSVTRAEEDGAEVSVVVPPDGLFVEGDEFGVILSSEVESVISKVIFSLDPETRKIRWDRIWTSIH